MITQEELKELLYYNPHTGRFFWRVSRGRAGAGSEAGAKDNNGYIFVGINGRRRSAHRLAFLYVNGSFPPEHVDHINGVRSDNRWENLRPATRSENAKNRKKVWGASKYIGVNRMRKKWEASIKVNGRKVFLGCYTKEVDAALAYDAAARRVHGEFASPNFP